MLPLCMKMELGMPLIINVSKYPVYLMLEE
jgi:hypothetical protein